jgi:hypothetical protein
MLRDFHLVVSMVARIEPGERPSKKKRERWITSKRDLSPTRQKRPRLGMTAESKNQNRSKRLKWWSLDHHRLEQQAPRGLLLALGFIVLA